VASEPLVLTKVSVVRFTNATSSEYPPPASAPAAAWSIDAVTITNSPGARTPPSRERSIQSWVLEARHSIGVVPTFRTRYTTAGGAKGPPGRPAAATMSSAPGRTSRIDASTGQAVKSRASGRTTRVRMTRLRAPRG
jgi:hypothetical protein